MTSGLSVRLVRSKSVTRKKGEDYEKDSATVESNLPDGLDALQALDQLAATLETHLAKSTASVPRPETASNSLLEPTTKTTTTAASSKVVGGLDPIALQKAEWKPDSTGRGHYCLGDELPALRDFLTASEKNTAAVGTFRFKLWTGGDAKLRISRWPHTQEPKR